MDETNKDQKDTTIASLPGLVLTNALLDAVKENLTKAETMMKELNNIGDVVAETLTGVDKFGGIDVCKHLILCKSFSY